MIMVEKIVVAPNEVRGYGNIVDNDKDKSDLCFYNSFVNADTDLIDGIRIGIMRMIYQDPNLFFSFHQLEKYLYVNSDDMTLSFDSTNKCLVFDDTTESFSLGFDSTNKVLYIGETGEHNYSIAFSQSSYTASGGSATLEITLLDNNVPVQGASVTVTGSDSSSYTGITNSSGVAEVTVTGVSGTVTFTCTYSNVSDTCTVTGSSYIVDISGMTDQSNEFGSILNFRSNGSSGSGSMSYDSTNHYYVFASTSTGQERFISIPALTGLNNFKMTFEAQVVTTHLFGFGEFVGSTNTNCSVFIGTDTNKFTKHQGSDTSIASGAAQATWYSFTVTVDSTGYYITIKDLNDNVKVDNYRCTISNSNTTQYGFTWGWEGTSKRFYLRNIKAEAL